MSRYSECKQTLLTNTQYAKKKNINIAIFLFDDKVRLYTNVKLSDETNEIIQIFKDPLYSSAQVYDNLSYDEIIMYINNSNPMGGTNFLAPFNLLEKIKEFDDPKNEIFFLSDGFNNTKLSKTNLEYLSRYKSRITTMGIGKKECFDHTTLSLMSKTDNTIEGESADIIQQELLAQMADASDHDIDIWKNVTVTIMCESNSATVATLMTVDKITEEEFKVDYAATSANPNLIIDEYNGNFLIKKKQVISEVDLKTDLLIFMVDQSGSMQNSVTNENIYAGGMHHGHLMPPSAYFGSGAGAGIGGIFPVQPFGEAAAGAGSWISPISTQASTEASEPLVISTGVTADLMLEDAEVETEVEQYIKYTIKFQNMKYYHRIIYSIINPAKFKAKIEWDDVADKHHVMVLHDPSKWLKQEDEYIKTIINLASIIGNCINVAGITDKELNIGNFRKISNICDKNKELFAELIDKPISDFSLSEVLFNNKKQAIKLYYSLLSPCQRNMAELLRGVSDGASRQLSASATMSVALQRSVSSQAAPEPEHNHNTTDMSLCTMCYSEVREYIFSCGHCYACKECAEKLLISAPKNTCAYCKQTVTWIRKLTMTEDQKDSKSYFKCITDECFNIATIVAKCKPMNEDDMGYHLTYCDKCFKHVVKSYKRLKKTHICFCGEEIKKIKEHVYFN